MIRNNLIGLLSNVLINVVVAVSSLMILILTPHRNENYMLSFYLCAPLTFIGAALFILVACKYLSNQKSGLRNLISVSSVSILSFIIWFYFYQTSFSSNPYIREIDGNYWFFNYYLKPLVAATKSYPYDSTTSSQVLQDIWTSFLSTPLLWVGLTYKNSINKFIRKERGYKS